MSPTLKILGIVGSLRRDSFNLKLMRAAERKMPAGTELRILTLEGIPPFNQDEEQQPPPAVTQLKRAIRDADALLIATPEYNYSIPGVLKNAIDWATRPYGDNPFRDKPGALMGATIGGMGTSRAQYHLRQVLCALNVHLLNQPELMISHADHAFDDEGSLRDEERAAQLDKLLQALVAWTLRLKGPQSE
ncbi:MAG: NAD(P)H-dependent oxidoreductase [Burkholderiales bacterium]|nr:NAD(P)H-dependent oxidoreductase [Burkholderiales bacterium]